MRYDLMSQTEQLEELKRQRKSAAAEVARLDSLLSETDARLNAMIDQVEALNDMIERLS